MEFGELAGQIDDERLQLFVFGPGTGESLAMRVPPGKWLIVDSCGGVEKDSGTIPALELIEAAEESVEMIVLTHPHTDHAVGLDRMIERFQPRWVGCVDQFIDHPVVQTANNGHWYECRKTWPARAAIKTYWNRHPKRKWDIRAGDIKQVGEATVQALHPPLPAVTTFAAQASPNPNDLSTPMAVSWQDARLILGADLPKSFWAEASAAASWDLATHRGLKVAHHGSIGAQDPALFGSDKGRRWIATPWRGGQHLPDYAANGGVELLLDHNPELVVTSLTRRAKTLPQPLTRQALEESLVVEELESGLKVRPGRRPLIAEAWAMASFSTDGSSDYQSGREALTVVR